MMLDWKRSLILVAVMAVVTMGLRFLPFAVFWKKTPKAVLYFGQVLPYAVMGMLVVYCLKDVSVVSGSHGIPEAISIALVASLHIWKKNTLLSMVAGTLCYMALVQFVF